MTLFIISFCHPHDILCVVDFYSMIYWMYHMLTSWFPMCVFILHSISWYDMGNSILFNARDIMLYACFMIYFAIDNILYLSVKMSYQYEYMFCEEHIVTYWTISRCMSAALYLMSSPLYILAASIHYISSASVGHTSTAYV